MKKNSDTELQGYILHAFSAEDRKKANKITGPSALRHDSDFEDSDNESDSSWEEARKYTPRQAPAPAPAPAKPSHDATPIDSRQMIEIIGRQSLRVQSTSDTASEGFDETLVNANQSQSALVPAPALVLASSSSSSSSPASSSPKAAPTIPPRNYSRGSNSRAVATNAIKFPYFQEIKPLVAFRDVAIEPIVLPTTSNSSSLISSKSGEIRESQQQTYAASKDSLEVNNCISNLQQPINSKFAQLKKKFDESLESFEQAKLASINANYKFKTSVDLLNLSITKLEQNLKKIAPQQAERVNSSANYKHGANNTLLFSTSNSDAANTAALISKRSSMARQVMG